MIDIIPPRCLGLVQVSILSAIAEWPDSAYGTKITSYVSKKIGRDLADAQIYVALARLEKYGLLKSRISEFSELPSRKVGRPRKYYDLTETGRRSLADARKYLSIEGEFCNADKQYDIIPGCAVA
jgi:DNA-binding PadR family transcriptional regulator